MQNKLSDKEILANIQRLILEANLNKSDVAILEEYRASPDAEIEAFLKRIKQLNFQANIVLKRKKFELATRIKKLLESSSESFDDLIARLSLNPANLPTVSLYRKFKGLNEEEMNAMLADQKILELLAQIDLEDDK